MIPHAAIAPITVALELAAKRDPACAGRRTICISGTGSAAVAIAEHRWASVGWMCGIDRVEYPEWSRSIVGI
jgi:hypothetical protein